MKKIFFIFILILSLQFSSAYIHINIYTDENGNSLFLGETSEIPNLPEGVNLEEDIISGMTDFLTNKQGDLWSFTYSLEGADLYIVLPEGATLKNVSNPESEISIEGNRISIYAKEQIDLVYTIDTQNSTYLGIFFLSILIVLIAVFFYFYFYKKKKNKLKQAEKFEIIKHTLSQRENVILENLKKTGKIKSSYLRKLTQIPKASFSRHILNLENKKLIARSGEGRNKFVELLNK